MILVANGIPCRNGKKLTDGIVYSVLDSICEKQGEDRADASIGVEGKIKVNGSIFKEARDSIPNRLIQHSIHYHLVHYTVS